jgi:hypothetical protein
MNFFDYLNSINTTKKDIMVTDQDQKAYTSYMVNRGLSYFPDTVLLANMMNQRYHLSSKMQYDFLRNAVPPKKRFSKWFKSEKLNDINLISDYFNVSQQKAKEYSYLLSNEDINIIRDRLDVGGVSDMKEKNK